MQFVCLPQNGVCSHCSEFILTQPVDNIIILLVHFYLIYIFWVVYVCIKVVIEKYILVTLIIIINVYLQYHIHVLHLFQQDELDEDKRDERTEMTYILMYYLYEGKHGAMYTCIGK